MQMCACQRVMLWAGSLVPCLGPQRATVETGWQCTKALTADGSGCSRTWISHHAGTICTEPHRTAEVVMVNGKIKHVLRELPMDTACEAPVEDPTPRHQLRPRANTVSYPLSVVNRQDNSETNYANIEFTPGKDAERERLLQVGEDGTTLNYANIEFAESLPFYENSNTVLSRLDGESKSELVTNKPPLPPRTQSNLSQKLSENLEKADRGVYKPPPVVNRSPKRLHHKQVNGSAYEMMYYQKNPDCDQNEDYLMMQPLCLKDEASKGTSDGDAKTCDDVSKVGADGDVEEEELPLRPFMPYSFPVPESPVPDSCQTLSRKAQLIHEDLHLRAMRSNSFSELKKKVLMRKRSSSVDGKNNGYLSKDSGVESVPASPVSSPRPSLQRKNSLFSKINLRSKEKSMSTNEIALPLPLSNGSTNSLINAHKSGHHRSADCLKLSEEFVNSDEDLNSDSSDFILQKESAGSCTSMKRSSSVPCRSALPVAIALSPARTNGPIEELNDLNKDAKESVASNVGEDSQELVQRKYSLDSHERKKQRNTQGVESNCDMYSQDCVDESDTVKELQGVIRRNHLHPSERGVIAENYRSNTSSCSSSDISDYMESLSFISRSSSSSSGSTSSTDYMRSEDMPYMLRTAPRPPPKPGPPASSSNTIAIPGMHHSRHPLAEVDPSGRLAKHRALQDDSSSSGTSSSSYMESACYKGRDETTSQRPLPPVRCSRDSRSSTSSTSSLSTSPSVTDYSSSTSSSSPPCQSNLPAKQLLSARKPQEAKSEEAKLEVSGNTKKGA